MKPIQFFLTFFLCSMWTAFVLGDEVHVTKVHLIKTHSGWAADVWLSHIDEGLNHYANWIEVRYDSGVSGGTRLIRRDITSPAKDNRKRVFYRVYIPSIPEEVSSIWFRGHCKVHSYGGEIVTVDLKNKKGEKYTISREERDIYTFPDRSHPFAFLRSPAARKGYLSTIR